MNNENNENNGVIKGGYICNIERTQELSDRMYQRNVPPHQLRPQFSMRPVPTKYATMPILDQRPIPKVPINNVPNYEVSKQFNPGNTTSPWDGFARNVNEESRLKNMFFGLQNCEQSIYVPSSKSDLYNERPVQTKPVENPFPYLSQREQFDSFNPNTCNIGNNVFNNFTRVQNVDAILETQGVVSAAEKKNPGVMTDLEYHDFNSNIQ